MSAKLERERVQQVDSEREHRIRSWSMARNEGIREGLLMAIAVVTSLGKVWGEGGDPIEEIKARGDRHFGDQEWQTKPRPR